jgi:hypothetical protein
MHDLKVNDILIAGAVGGVTGMFDGGTTRFVKWITSPRGQKIAQKALEFIIDAVANLVENVAKELVDDKEGVDVKKTIYDALAEAGLGSVLKSKTVSTHLKSKTVSQKINNAQIDISKLKKKAPTPKTSNKLASAKKEANFWKGVEDTSQLPAKIAANGFGNMMGERLGGGSTKSKGTSTAASQGAGNSPSGAGPARFIPPNTP